MVVGFTCFAGLCQPRVTIIKIKTPGIFKSFLDLGGWSEDVSEMKRRAHEGYRERRVRNSGVKFIMLFSFLSCMKLDDLKEEHLVEVVRLYELHCGFRREFREAMFQQPETVLQNLKEQGREEYRIGSKWDGHSKIYFETDFEDDVVVRFNSNFDPRDRKGRDYKAAEKAGQEFVKAAMQYLSSQ